MPAADYFVGTDVNDVINVDFGTLSGIASYTSTALGLTATGAADVATVTAAQGAMAAVDNAIDNISEARATAGALISRFEFRGQIGRASCRERGCEYVWIWGVAC